MGPESGDPEIACQSQLGGVITTGGGFSTYSPTPEWQHAAVNTYLARSSAAAGYNPNGRAYPDVSMIGVWYQVVVNNQLSAVFGTSASSPVFAAMVGLVNTARVKAGKEPVGFMNPTLYAFGANSTYYNDVTSGENNCLSYGDVNHPSGATCCESGFTAIAGWDPTTGFGSINYINLLNMFNGDPASFPSSKNADSLSDGAVAGIVVGAVAGVVIIAALIWFFACKAGSSGMASQAA